MKKYQKKPVIVEAVQYIYPASPKLKNWLGQSCGTERRARCLDAKGELEITTLEDGFDGRVKHIATEGDFIIKGIKGEFYACKPDIFQETYIEVED